MAAPDKMGVHRLGALCVIAACFAAVGQGSQPSLSVEADSVTFDLRSNSSVSKDVTISDGRIRIEAGEGRSTGGQAGDGSWALRGGVRIAIDSARLYWTFNLVDRTASGSGEGDDKCVVRIPIRRR